MAKELPINVPPVKPKTADVATPAPASGSAPLAPPAPDNHHSGIITGPGDGPLAKAGGETVPRSHPKL